jgi:hypothetical protein
VRRASYWSFGNSGKSMDRSEQIAELVAKLPPGLKTVLDAALAAGHRVIDFDIGSGRTYGKTWLVLDHPLRIKPDVAPPGIKYMELLDRDPQLWGFYTEDESLSIVTAKLKPFKLDPLPIGPENPTEKHIAQMKLIQEREENAAAERAAAANAPPPPPVDPKTLAPYDRFINSMIITFEMWHDGNGYDLDALKLLDPPEIHAIEQKLIQHSPRDWRDIEALAQIDSEAARKAVEAGLQSADEHVRRVAREYAGQKQPPEDREKLLLQSLAKDDLFGGLSQAIDEAAEFHPPTVVEALIKGAANRTGQTAIHFAALLYFIHGKSKEPFDWDHRPFFLRFDTPNREERKAVFRELCATIGVDASKYVR